MRLQCACLAHMILGEGLVDRWTFRQSACGRPVDSLQVGRIRVPVRGAKVRGCGAAIGGGRRRIKAR